MASNHTVAVNNKFRGEKRRRLVDSFRNSDFSCLGVGKKFVTARCTEETLEAFLTHLKFFSEAESEDESNSEASEDLVEDTLDLAANPDSTPPTSYGPLDEEPVFSQLWFPTRRNGKLDPPHRLILAKVGEITKCALKDGTQPCSYLIESSELSDVKTAIGKLQVIDNNSIARPPIIQNLLCSENEPNPGFTLLSLKDTEDHRAYTTLGLSSAENVTSTRLLVMLVSKLGSVIPIKDQSRNLEYAQLWWKHQFKAISNLQPEPSTEIGTAAGTENTENVGHNPTVQIEAWIDETVIASQHKDVCQLKGDVEETQPPPVTTRRVRRVKGASALGNVGQPLPPGQPGTAPDSEHFKTSSGITSTNENSTDTIGHNVRHFGEAPSSYTDDYVACRDQSYDSSMARDQQSTNSISIDTRMGSSQCTRSPAEGNSKGDVLIDFFPEPPPVVPLQVHSASQPKCSQEKGSEAASLIDYLPDSPLNTSSQSRPVSQRFPPGQRKPRSQNFSTATSIKKGLKSDESNWTSVNEGKSHDLLGLCSAVKPPAIRQTMRQKAASRAPIPDGTINQQDFMPVETLERARSQPGPLAIKLELGRFLIDSATVPKQKRNVRYSPQQWNSVMSSEGDQKVRVNFNNRLTTSGAQAESILDLKLPKGKKLVEREPQERYVTYEVHCETPQLEEIVVSVCENGSYKFRPAEVILGASNCFYAKRSWDARLVIKGSRMIGGDYSSEAGFIARSLRVTPVAATSGISIGIQTPSASFRILGIVVRRESVHRSPMYPDLQLRLAEVSDTGCKALADVPTSYTGSMDSPLQMSATQRVWWTASVTSTHIHSILRANELLELGEHAGWSPEEVLQHELVGDLMSMGEDIVTRIDHVGLRS